MRGPVIHISPFQQCHLKETLRNEPLRFILCNASPNIRAKHNIPFYWMKYVSS
jgi:hypothetical protein